MHRLYKKEKLCSTLAIEALFRRGAGVHSALAYPLRAVWRENAGRKSDAPVQFLVSVPKKKLRHAVDRVLMRRRIREAYRLHHQSYPVGERKYDVVFIYAAQELCPYAKVERAMHKILGIISSTSAPHAQD